MLSSSRTVAVLVTLLAAVAMSATLGVTRHDAADAATGIAPGTALFRFGSQWNVVSGHERYEYLIVGRSAAAAAGPIPTRDSPSATSPTISAP